MKELLDSQGIAVIIESYSRSRNISCLININNGDIYNQYNYDIIQQSNPTSILSKLSWDINSVSSLLLLSATTLNSRRILQDTTHSTIFPLPSINPKCIASKDILDVIFLIDNSCGLSMDECRIQSNGILDLILSVKVDNISPRIGVIEYANTRQNYIWYGLYDNSTYSLIDIFANFTCIPQQANTDLSAGIHFARNHFEAEYMDNTEYYKLIIISNCMDDAEDVCTQSLYINNDINKKIDIIAINIDGTTNGDIVDPNTYLDCIADIIYSIPVLQPSSFEEILTNVSDDICPTITTIATTTNIATTPSPTDPNDILICGDRISGDFNNKPITFTVNIPYDGDITFDTKSSLIIINNITALTFFSTNGRLTLINLIVGEYQFTIHATDNTFGRFTVEIFCESDMPTTSPTTSIPTLSSIPTTECGTDCTLCIDSTLCNSDLINNCIWMDDENICTINTASNLYETCWEIPDTITCNNQFYQTTFGCEWNIYHETCHCPLRANDFNILYFIDISSTAVPNQTYFNHIASFLDINRRVTTPRAQDVYLYDEKVSYPQLLFDPIKSINISDPKYQPRTQLSNISLAIDTAIAKFNVFPSDPSLPDPRDVLVIFSGQKQSDYTRTDHIALCKQYNITLIIYSYTINDEPTRNLSCLINTDSDSSDAYNEVDYNWIVNVDDPGWNIFPLDAKYSWDICNAVPSQFNLSLINTTFPPTSLPTAPPTFRTSMFVPPTTENPTTSPTVVPTLQPTPTPTPEPTPKPTFNPTLSPSTPTDDPTPAPTPNPTIGPTFGPTDEPTTEPTVKPTALTDQPTSNPTTEQTDEPTIDPTVAPTIELPPGQTHEPTVDPTVAPTTELPPGQTYEPTADPTVMPTIEVTPEPTAEPTTNPTTERTTEPTIGSSIEPTSDPVTIPSEQPALNPFIEPSKSPNIDPIPFPTNNPTNKHTAEPTLNPIKPTTSSPSSPTITAPPTSYPSNPSSTSSPAPIPIPIPTDFPTQTPTKPSYPSINPTSIDDDCDLPLNIRPCHCFINKQQCTRCNRPDCIWEDVEREYIYVKTIKSWQEAQVHCNRKFGTDLATIIDDNDMNTALLTVYQPDMVWIGLFNDIESCLSTSPTTHPTINVTPSPTQPMPIICGESRFGDYNNQPIIFEFHLPSTAKVILDTCTSDFGAFIMLSEQSTGDILDSWDNCRITVHLSSGTYLWLLSALTADDVFGIFNMDIVCIASPTPEPTISDISSTLSPAADVDSSALPTNTPNGLNTHLCCDCTTASPLSYGCVQDSKCSVSICGTDITCCRIGWDLKCAEIAKKICYNVIPTLEPTYLPTVSPTGNAGAMELYLYYNETDDMYWRSRADRYYEYTELIRQAVFHTLQQISGYSMDYEDKHEYVDTSWKYAGITQWRPCYVFNIKIGGDPSCPTISNPDPTERQAQFAAVVKFNMVSDQNTDDFYNYLIALLQTDTFLDHFSVYLNKVVGGYAYNQYRRRLLGHTVHGTQVIAIYIVDKSKNIINSLVHSHKQTPMENTNASSRRLSDDGCIEWMWIDGTKCTHSRPTQSPSRWPTILPPILSTTHVPTIQPTSNPTTRPTQEPSFDPTTRPTKEPSFDPTSNPTTRPTKEPSFDPTKRPTIEPTKFPTISPTPNPTTEPTSVPTANPTTFEPTKTPSKNPTLPTIPNVPTFDPSSSPITLSPSVQQTIQPTTNPSSFPTFQPTINPTINPTEEPTLAPTASPTGSPIVTPNPSPIERVDRLQQLDAKWVNINGAASPIGTCNVARHDDVIQSYMYRCEDDDGDDVATPIKSWYIGTRDCSGNPTTSDINFNIIDFNCNSDFVVRHTLKIRKYNKKECHLRIQDELFYVEEELIVDHCVTDSNNKSYLYQCSSNGGYIINTFDDRLCTQLISTKPMDSRQCVEDKIEQVLQCNSDYIVPTNFSVDIVVSNFSIDLEVITNNNPIVCWRNMIGQAFYGGYYDEDWNDIPGDVCDHEPPEIGEVRDACYFEVKFGQNKWKRNCIHHTECPNNGQMGCVGNSTEQKCCCNQNYCNDYMDLAIRGYTSTPTPMPTPYPSRRPTDVTLSPTQQPTPMPTPDPTDKPDFDRSGRRLLSVFNTKEGLCTDLWKNYIYDFHYDYCAVLLVKERKFMPMDCKGTYPFLCAKPTNKTGICRSNPTTDKPTTDKSTTMNPTTAPSRISTNEPSIIPTAHPSDTPITNMPTINPTMPGCNNMDIIFVVDVGCTITGNQCESRQNAISDMILSLNNISNNIRIGYVVYTQNAGFTAIHLNDYNFNTNLDDLIIEIKSQFCYIPGKSSIYAGIDQAIDEFTSYDDDPSHSNKRIILLSGCMNEGKLDPCYFTNNGETDMIISGNKVEFTVINTIGNDASNIIDPYNHLKCLSKTDDRLFVVEQYNINSWKKVINNFKYTMCGIERITNSPTMEPSASPTNKYIKCWSSDSYDYKNKSQVCRNTEFCYFSVGIGKEEWKRSCSNNIQCASIINKESNNCIYGGEQIECCCKENYCNIYEKEADKGFMAPTMAPITSSPTTECALSEIKRPCKCFLTRNECETVINDKNRIDCIWYIDECIHKSTPSPTRKPPTKRPTRRLKTQRPTRRIKG